jgi:hypothetical protein
MTHSAELPWPVPDQRFRLWAGQFADMHDLVRNLDIPQALTPAAASVLTTARELIRMSYYRYEFMMIGAATSIIALETALSERYGKGTLAKHLKQARADGILTDEQRTSSSTSSTASAAPSATSSLTATSRTQHSRRPSP